MELTPVPVKVEVRVLTLRRGHLKQLPYVSSMPWEEYKKSHGICWISGVALGLRPSDKRILVELGGGGLVLVDMLYASNATDCGWYSRTQYKWNNEVIPQGLVD